MVGGGGVVVWLGGWVVERVWQRAALCGVCPHGTSGIEGDRRAHVELPASLPAPAHPPLRVSRPSPHAPNREERRALEEKYAKLYTPLYDRRSKVVNGEEEAPENLSGERGAHSHVLR